MEHLYSLYTANLERTNTDFIRYLHSRINWDSRLIVIMGARGVGKTTMILQHIKLTNSASSSLYVSADNTYFSGHSLFDVASDFYKRDGRVLYIDEVHKYKNWSAEVKMMYDNLPELKVVVTGSSILDIKKGTDADLSRRAIPYTLEGLSFREYLNFTKGLNIKPFSLEDILNHKAKLPKSILHPLPLWSEYLHHGYYPFFMVDDYFLRLDSVINHTVEIDIPTFANMNISTSLKLKRLLYVIAGSVPFKPNLTEIGRAIGADRGIVADYMLYMEKAGIIRQLHTAERGMKVIEKVDKVYLSNPTLIYSQAEGKPDIGNLRETAFFSQMQVENKVYASPISDFKIGKYTFEVGGKSKKQDQIKDVPNSFVVKDDIEQGYLNVIPLWHFGLNY